MTTTTKHLAAVVVSSAESFGIGVLVLMNSAINELVVVENDELRNL